MKQLENGNFVDDNGNLLNGKINWKIFTCWFKQGLLHNENGPAIQYPDYRKDWYVNGEKHIEEKPNAFYQDSDNEWWIEGTQYSEEEFNIYLKKKILNQNLQKSLIIPKINPAKLKI